MKTLKDLLDRAMSEIVMFDEDFPVQVKITESKSTKFFAVIGDNASGKSFITSNLLGVANNIYKVKGYHLGMKNRTSGGMESVFVYGEEATQSTGATTLSAVIGGLNNLKEKAENEGTKMLLILDEPTIGLSIGYEKAMGKYIAQVFNEIKDIENVVGIMIVSHSKIMFKEIEKAGVELSVISVDGNLTMEEWYNKEEDNTVEELLSLRDKGLNKFREISKYINNLSKN